ncbi:hypothetical protein OS493_039255, partial [Desmophyllum pertusum]
LPSIVSSSQIGMIDPHEEYFGDGKNRRTGHRWRMKEDRAIMDTIPDQFQPYKGIFTVQMMFSPRDPIMGRCSVSLCATTPSELSQTLYSAERVHTFV